MVRPSRKCMERMRMRGEMAGYARICRDSRIKYTQANLATNQKVVGSNPAGLTKGLAVISSKMLRNHGLFDAVISYAINAQSARKDVSHTVCVVKMWSDFGR